MATVSTQQGDCLERSGYMDLSLLGRISRRYNVVSAVNSATRKSQHNARTHRRSTVHLHTADPVADQPLLLLIILLSPL